MLTGDPETDELASLSFAAWSALVIRRQELEAELIALDYDGPPTVRDVESEGPDTSPETSHPTLPCIYSRSAA